MSHPPDEGKAGGSHSILAKAVIFPTTWKTWSRNLFHVER